MNPVKNLFPSSRLQLVTRLTPAQTAERKERFTPHLKDVFKASVYDSAMKSGARDDDFKSLLDALECHHCHPISLGGSPVDPNNLILIAPRVHKLVHSLIGRQLDFNKTGYIYIPYPDKDCKIVLRPDYHIKCDGFICRLNQ